MGAVSASKRRDEGREEVEKPEDVFVNLVRSQMELALNQSNWENKDRNVLFANCIKFIAVTNKLRGEEGSFFDD
jgi:hypothetical protein